MILLLLKFISHTNTQVTHTNTHMQTHTHIHTHTHKRTHTHTNTQVTHTNTHMQTHTQTHRHTHRQTDTDTHTHYPVKSHTTDCTQPLTNSQNTNMSLAMIPMLVLILDDIN